MSVLAACDLDRTAIFATLPPDPPPVRCVEEIDGRPWSYVTETAAALLADLLGSGAFVPVTTRTLAQYQRITLPGPTPRHALCANGGRLVTDGVEDLAFAARTAELLAGTAPVAAVYDEVQRRIGGDPRISSIRVADDLFCYVVLHRGSPADDLAAVLVGVAEAADWRVSVQGRKLYAVPAPLSKASGLARLREVREATTVLAAGDSLLDAGMLEAADHAMLPRDSELTRIGWTHPTARVTDATGLLAGEEILRWIHAHLGRGDSGPVAASTADSSLLPLPDSRTNP